MDIFIFNLCTTVWLRVAPVRDSGSGGTGEIRSHYLALSGKTRRVREQRRVAKHS